MNELKSLEHATLKVPYEVFNKRYRNAQRILDVDARQVSSVAGELDTATGRGATTGEIDSLLGGMVEKLTTMKRKASEANSEEVQAAYVCKKRLEHLKEQASALVDPNTPQVRTNLNQWRKVRLDRMLVDYFLRNGYYDTANKLADARGLRDLSNVDIYTAAAEVETELRSQRTGRCLQWCADNKSKLRKLNSNMEFKIRIQEFIELVREDKRLEAVRYAKKHFSTYEEGQLQDIQHCMGMLAFPKDTDVEPYRSLLQAARWAALVAQFRWEHARLLHPARLPALPVALQLGLQALNTPQCYQDATKVLPHVADVEPYRSLLQAARWAALVAQFRWEHARLLHPARLPALPVALQLGLQALNTPQCYQDATKVLPHVADVEPYRSLLQAARWAALVAQFRWEHARLLHPARLPALPVALQLGLQALNTPQCYQDATKVLPHVADVEPYRSLLQAARWAALVAQFRWEHARLLHPARLPALPVALQLGLQALNTPQCYQDATKVAACPVCQPPLNRLARALPHAHCSHSRLVCRLSGRALNEHNQPMVLPNGQVYGEKALKEMMKEHGSIICPKTKEVFCMKRVEKVYVM